jgi:hypothetical protein
MPTEQNTARARIRFYMTGPAFESDIPLHLMLTTLQDFQSILDKTYLGLTGRKRMSREERFRFELRSQGIKTGSLKSYFDIVLNGSQTFLPMFTVASPADIWEYTKSAFECLKAVFKNFKRQNQPTYSASDKATIIHTEDNSSHVTNNYSLVMPIAKETMPHYMDMIAHIKDEGVDSISFGPETSPITLGEPETRIFHLATTIDKNPVTFECTVIAFHKIKRAGKLIVCKNQHVPVGEYKFNIIGNQDFNTFIQAFKELAVTVTALREIRVDPFDPNVAKIVALQIIAIQLETKT